MFPERTLNIHYPGTGEQLVYQPPAQSLLASDRPNWLLYGLIGLSLLLHSWLIYHDTTFKTKRMTYIELTMQDIPRPVVQDIPRPKPLVEPPQEIPARIPEPILRSVPKAQPIQTIAKSEPDVPVIRRPPVAKHRPVVQKQAPHPPVPVIAAPAPPPQPSNRMPDRSAERQNYLSLIQQSIEQHKRYPLVARRRHIEGRVNVRFVISPTGLIDKIEIVQSSGQEILDRATLKAVREASPLPPPPAGLFAEDTVMELTIVFKLT